VGIVLVATTLVVALAAKARADTTTQQRATLLADSLVDKHRTMPGRGAGWVVGGLGVVILGVEGYIAIGFANEASSRSTTSAWIGAAGGGLLALGGFGSEFVEEDYYETVLRAGGEAALGVELIGLDLLIENASLAISAGAFFGDAALRFVDAAIQRPISARRLSRRYRSIWRPELRDEVTEEQLVDIERDFRRSSPSLSPWLLHAPLLVGSAVDFAMLARSDYEAEDRYVAAAMGSLLLVIAGSAIWAEENSGWNRYEQQLENTGFKLSLVALPMPGLGVLVTY
jgi:hypothetical protein